jgi:hypothetical protein
MRTAPLLEDCTTFIDIAPVGADVVRLFWTLDVSPTQLAIAGDAEGQENGRIIVPLRNMHASVAIAFEQERLVALEGLDDATMLLRLLAEPAMIPERGPTADLARAATIAVWAGNRYPTGGPWASAKPPKPGTREEIQLEEIELVKRAAQRAKERAERDWWEPVSEDWWMR